MAKKFTKKEVSWVLDRLEETFPDTKPELVASNPFEVLVVTVLSAQCTDVRVNMVTKEVYKKYKTPQDLIDLGVQGLELLIRSYGFYKNKAKNVVATVKILAEGYQSQMPETIEELVELLGVGQKTTNIMASTCFRVNTITVNAHVFRISDRIGLARVRTVKETKV